MSARERVRLEAFGRVKRGELTVSVAAELAGLSRRQAWRVWKRFNKLGDRGLVHLLRGKSSNRRLSDDVRDRVVKRHQERYADFGPTLACEKLAEDGMELSPDTLTALLKERGLWQRKRRRGAAIANVASVGRAWDRWCRWMGAITIGSRSARASVS